MLKTTKFLSSEEWVNNYSYNRISLVHAKDGNTEKKKISEHLNVISTKRASQDPDVPDVLVCDVH